MGTYGSRCRLCAFNPRRSAPQALNIFLLEPQLTTPDRYLFSISISVYNKWMFKLDNPQSSDDPNDVTDPNEPPQSHHIFPFPLFTTCLHMIVQFSLASLVLFLVPSLRPRHDSLNPHAAGVREREREEVDPKKPLMTRWFYVTRIGPCGVATGLDIGLGNTSLKFISLTFFSGSSSSSISLHLHHPFNPSQHFLLFIMHFFPPTIVLPRKRRKKTH